MNIRPPGSGPAGGPPPVDPSSETDAQGTDVDRAGTRPTGESFADRMQPAQGATGATNASSTDATRAIAADLQSGAITAEEATSRLIQQTLDSIPSNLLSEEARAEIVKLLEQLTETDPTLQNLARGLGRS